MSRGGKDVGSVATFSNVKVGNVPDEPGGGAEVTGQIVEGAALFLLMQRE